MCLLGKTGAMVFSTASEVESSNTTLSILTYQNPSGRMQRTDPRVNPVIRNREQFIQQTG